MITILHHSKIKITLVHSLASQLVVVKETMRGYVYSLSYPFVEGASDYAMLIKAKKFMYYFFISLLSLVINIAIKMVDFKRLLQWFTNTDHASPKRLTNVQINRLVATVNILDHISSFLPWRIMCFEKGLVILVLARVLKINVNLHFGINKDENDNLCAHAWTISDGSYITGGDAATHFKELYHRGVESDR